MTKDELAWMLYCKAVTSSNYIANLRAANDPNLPSYYKNLAKGCRIAVDAFLEGATTNPENWTISSGWDWN